MGDEKAVARSGGRRRISDGLRREATVHRHQMCAGWAAWPTRRSGVPLICDINVVGGVSQLYKL